MAVAKTLEHILDDGLVKRIMDRSQPIREVIDQVLSIYKADLKNRKPAPVYLVAPDGTEIHQATDFDLFTFFMALSGAKTIINIPDYERMREKSSSTNRYSISENDRHGNVVRLVSHKESHSFSALIMDQQTLEFRGNGRNRTGAPTNFALVDDSGQLYEGLKGFEWVVYPELDDFIKRNRLETSKDSLKFQYFVTPALASSFYSSRYLAAKILEARVEDQISGYKKLIKKLREKDIKLSPPPDEDEEPIGYWKGGDKKSLGTKNLEAKLVIPEFKGKYKIYGFESYRKDEKPKLIEYEKMPTDKENLRKVLRYALSMVRKLTYTYGPMVRVPTRAVELAFFLYGFKNPENNEPGTETKPGWDVPDFVRDYKEGPKKRIMWNMLEYNPEVQLLYRIKETTTKVRAPTIAA